MLRYHSPIHKLKYVIGIKSNMLLLYHHNVEVRDNFVSIGMNTIVEYMVVQLLLLLNKVVWLQQKKHMLHMVFQEDNTIKFPSHQLVAIDAK